MKVFSSQMLFPRNKTQMLSIRSKSSKNNNKKIWTMDYLAIVYYSSSTNFSTNMMIPPQNI